VSNACDFRIKELNTSLIVEHWQNSQGEENDTHASNPLHNASPHDYAFGDSL
jgi:hypothetical protein